MAMRVVNEQGVTVGVSYLQDNDVEIIILLPGCTARWRGTLAGVTAVFGPQSEIGLAMARAIADANAQPTPAAPARAFPGSGDPGDPGLGKPGAVETDGPAGPDEG